MWLCVCVFRETERVRKREGEGKRETGHIYYLSLNPSPKTFLLEMRTEKLLVRQGPEHPLDK